MRIYRILKLTLFFVKELVIANIQVATWVFKNKQNMKPAIFVMPLRLKSDQQILLLTSMITLTPGTLSLEVSEDKKKLWIHCLHADSIEETRQSIVQGFEQLILEAFS